MVLWLHISIECKSFLRTNPASFPGHNMGVRLPLSGEAHMYIHKLGRDLFAETCIHASRYNNPRYTNYFNFITMLQCYLGNQLKCVPG